MTTPNPDDLRSPEQLPGVSRVTAVDLAQRMQTLYADAETRIAAGMARRLAAGMDSPRWALDKLEQIARLRAHTERVLARLAKDTTYETHYALVSAYLRGGVEATRTLTQLGMNFPAHPDAKLQALLDGPKSRLTVGLTELAQAFPGIAGIMRVAGSLALRITGTHLPVLRWAQDAYRQVIAAGALTDVLGGLATRRRASQVAWEKLLSEGITGFTDRAGRNWNLATYVEMATRTGVAQAAVEGHMDRLADAGLNLVMVSNAPQECARCRRWEGKILERQGQEGRHPIIIENIQTGRLQRIEVAGTIGEAIRAGLMHPNCRHRLVLYVHGATKIPTDTADPEGDAARQHLRHLERNVRREKLKAVAAIDPAARTVHERKARAWQEKIRTHVADTGHLGIFRHREREQINLGNGPYDTTITPAKPKAATAQEDSVTAVMIRDAAAQMEAMERKHPRWQDVAPRREAANTSLDRIEARLAQRPDLLAELAGIRGLVAQSSGGSYWAELMEKLARRISHPTPAKATAEPSRLVSQTSAQQPEDHAGSIGSLFSHPARLDPDRLDELREVIANRLDGDYAGLNMQIVNVAAQGEWISFEGRIATADGRYAGTTTRRFYSTIKHGAPVLWVYHAYLQLESHVQGQGFAQAWNGHLEEWYRQSGVAYIKVTANIDVGGYTWARQGFDFADMVGPTQIAANLRRVLTSQKFTVAQVAKVYEMLDRMDLGFGDPDFPTAHEVSQVGRIDGQGKDDMWPGKMAMLGSTWAGIKWLT